MNIWIYVITTVSFFLFCGIILYYSRKNERFTTTKPNLFIYWEQGWDSAPYLCKQCLRSWIKYNKNDFNIIALDNNTIKQYIPENEINIINRIKQHKSVTASSDLLRVNLLAQNGGFWVDATIMCTQPIMRYYHRLQNKYDFWCPFDFDSKMHSYNYIFNKKHNPLFITLAKNMNDHFNALTNEELNKMDYLYIGKLMFRELDKMIDWNVIKQNQLSQSSNNKKMGYKLVANSDTLILQPITDDLKTKLDNEYFLKLTTKHGIHEYTKFDENTVIQYLINKHSV